MAQQNIDFGSFPNDPGADAIRTAFEKVQQNFTDLYTTTFSSGVTQVITGPGLNQTRPTGDVKITANIPNITIQTSSSLRVGVGVATGNTATISSWVTPFVIDLSSNITTANANIGNITVANLNVTNRVTSSLVPSVDVTYNLGSPTRRWKDLYLSGNTIDLGGSLISASGGIISVASLAATTTIQAPTMTISESISSPVINIGNVNITNNGGNVVMPALQIGQTILNPSGLTVNGNVSAGTVSAGFVQGTLTTASQPNITSVGVLSGLAVSGDMSTGNMTVVNTITTGIGANAVSIGPDGITVGTGTSQTSITGAGVQLAATASLQAPGSSGQITFNDGGNAAAVPGLTFDKTINLLSIAGNVSGGNLVSTGVLSLTKDANIGGNVTSANLLTGRVEATSIISSGGSNVVLDPAGTVTAIGNISGGNIVTNGLVSTANLNATFIVSTGNANITGMMNTGNLTTTGTANVVGNIIGGNLVTSGLANIGGLITSGTANVGLLISTGHANITGNVTAGNLTANGTLSAGNLSTEGNLSAGNILSTFGAFTNSNTAGTHRTRELIVSSDANVQGTHRAFIGFTTGTHTAGNLHTDGNANVVGTHTAGFIVINNNSEVKGTHKTANLQVTTNANFDAGMFVTNNANVGSMKVRGDHNVDGNVNSAKVTSNIATFGATPNDPGTSLTVNGVVSVVGNASIGNITAINSVTGNVISLTGNASGTALVAAGLVRVGGNHAVTQNISVGVSISIRLATVTGGQLTLTFTTAESIAPFFPGQKVVLAGFASNPVGTNYNIEYTVTELLGTPGNYTGIKVPTSFSTPINVYGTVTTAGNALTVSGNLLGASMILAGSHKVDGNITGGNILTNGTANVGNLIATLDGTFKGKVDINGNTTLYSNGDVTGKTFTASLFTGNGSSLTNLSGVNIDNSSINAQSKLTNLAEAVSTLSVASATSSGSITTVNGLPAGSYTNITGVGTLGSLTVTGTVLGGNIGNSATKFTGNGAGITNVTAAKVDASNIDSQNGMWASTNRPGATRLYRRDADNNYNLQVNDDGSSRWHLQGYNDNTLHWGVRVAYADSAGSAGSATSATSAGSATTATTATYVTGLTSANVTGALGYTPISSQYSPPQGIDTTSNPQFNSLGIGTSASGTGGEIRATNNITAYYSSDIKFKENVRPIINALEKVLFIGGKLFDWSDEYIKAHGGEDGYFIQKQDFGVIAQDVQKVFPEAVRTRPDGTLAVDYEKLAALAFQAIVDLEEKHANDIQSLQNQINTIMNLLKDKE